ncbi:MAG: hypothetical protein LUQ67_07150 [Methanomicrobiales archaeon]|nr:hypothetical protein [Methanomicrobiales archaeon]
MKRVVEIGGKALSPKMAVPGVGYNALCQDPEGNVFGIMEMDPAAKWTPAEEKMVKRGQQL